MRHLFFFVHQRIQAHLGFFGQIPTFSIAEGETIRYIHADGSTDEMELRKASASFTAPMEQNILSDEEILKNLDSVAQQIAEQRKKAVFKTVEEVTSKTGNVFNAKLSELGLGAFVEMLQRMPIDFNPDGSPQMPSIVCHPDVYRTLKEREEKGLDEEAKKQMDAIIEQKRIDFLDRESRRRLAD